LTETDARDPELPADHDAALERRRQQALDALGVLDSDAEAAFDGLVQAAAAICGTPIALISLIDRHRQWFKANVGLEGVRETPRAISFCTHAIEPNDLFVVEDALLDPRFATNPLVTDDPRIRFDAGAPLQLSDAAAVGTLCVIARQPQQFDSQQRLLLEQLGLTAVHLLEGRRALQAEAESRREAERTCPGPNRLNRCWPRPSPTSRPEARIGSRRAGAACTNWP